MAHRLCRSCGKEATYVVTGPFGLRLHCTECTTRQVERRGREIVARIDPGPEQPAFLDKQSAEPSEQPVEPTVTLEEVDQLHQQLRDAQESQQLAQEALEGVANAGANAKALMRLAIWLHTEMKQLATLKRDITQETQRAIDAEIAHRLADGTLRGIKEEHAE